MTPEPRTITITARANHGFIRNLVEEIEGRLRDVDPHATVVHDALDHGQEPTGRIVLEFRGSDLPGALHYFDERLADWFSSDVTENATSEDPVEKAGEPGVFVVLVQLMEPSESVDASMVSRAVSECLTGYPDALQWSGTWQPPGGDPVRLSSPHHDPREG